MHARWHSTLLCTLLVVPTITFAATPAAASKQEKKDQSSATALPPPETQEQKLERAWQLIRDNVKEEKHLEAQTQALSALADLGADPKANALIAEAMKDPDLDVRSAAIVAAGKTKSRALVAPVEKLLDDPEPQVAYTAATVLWKEFNDHSGEDILDSIVSGGRKAGPTLMHGAEHQMSRTLHSPSALAQLGVTQGAGFLLGPFGFSITAIQYMRKNGSDEARVQSLMLLADEKTQGVRDDLMDALTDKDPGMRATGARMLGNYRDKRYATAIGPLIDDDKLPVRLTASAAYIKSLGGGVPVHSHLRHK
ncbi:MAG: HEAT repeat domain-containing protein [Acidobacteriaceae bacterium]|nr:HEAT repeat domain-containing protein [Acidobacteriaceae bacterium]